MSYAGAVVAAALGIWPTAGMADARDHLLKTSRRSFPFIERAFADAASATAFLYAAFVMLLVRRIYNYTLISNQTLKGTCDLGYCI